ncbi:hypothetical protein CYMTET_41360 [Cymbomonas tetramitiformis]|uniref:Ion transport domain-containing protein n=1 Tax=Cymbomonas tetramitiformis TaxID=36881 RepID=A0AAE0F2B9_9CHLO|nr:hypothetical protein CYMTET_41360 [Cymbomonas tetramitiformis]
MRVSPLEPEVDTVYKSPLREESSSDVGDALYSGAKSTSDPPCVSSVSCSPVQEMAPVTTEAHEEQLLIIEPAKEHNSLAATSTAYEEHVNDAALVESEEQLLIIEPAKEHNSLAATSTAYEEHVNDAALVESDMTGDEVDQISLEHVDADAARPPPLGLPPDTSDCPREEESASPIQLEQSPSVSPGADDPYHKLNKSVAKKADPPDPPVKKRRVNFWEACGKMKLSIWNLMNDPQSSLLAHVISLIILVLIAVSSVTFCLETMEEYSDDESKRNFAVIEDICVLAFTIEYVLKLLTAPNVGKFFITPMNLLDLFAILPYFLEKLAGAAGGLSNTRIFRVLRLVRVFRVFKVGGFARNMEVVTLAVTRSMDLLGMLSFILALVVILFASLIYYCEKGGDQSGFDSIPVAFWWTVVTVTTTGYGDFYPVTFAGQLAGSILMLISVIIVALPIAVVGTEFTQVWEEHDREEKFQKQNVDMDRNFEREATQFQVHDRLLGTLLNESNLTRKMLQRIVDIINMKMDELFEATEEMHGQPLTLEREQKLFEMDKALLLLFDDAIFLEDRLEDCLSHMLTINSDEHVSKLRDLGMKQKKAKRRIEERDFVVNLVAQTRKQMSTLYSQIVTQAHQDITPYDN